MNAKNKESLLEVRLILQSSIKERNISCIFLNYLLFRIMDD